MKPPFLLEEFSIHEIPLIQATDESLTGYGELVDNYEEFPIEIVRWPAQGWRPVDEDTGDEAGTTEGIFRFKWFGDILCGVNEAVDDSYLIGWSCDPVQASSEEPTAPRDRLLIWHANYHPDGGQLFYSLDGKPFISMLALPGDDISPDKFKAFYCDGSKALYIHPNVWHEAQAPIDDDIRFFDRQGKVHARVSVNFPKEFGCYLSVPLRKAG
ncbi:ureidoglycolate lyase [Aestuariispira insulae]|nr:ureidoglycolate lyase [Aestuariispira insulae]